jgi:hypothetical protein
MSDTAQGDPLRQAGWKSKKYGKFPAEGKNKTEKENDPQCS